MKFFVAFTLCGGLLLWVALGRQPPNWWAIWPATSLLLVGMAYGLDLARPGLGVHIWGKDSRGRIRRLSGLLMFPYIVVSWIVWHAHRWGERRPAGTCVHPGPPNEVWLGRWPYANELPPGTTLVVDLTAEWPMRSGVATRACEYRCVPMLDGSTTSLGDLVSLLERIDQATGAVYLHCAFGQGRSAMIAAAVLVRRGVCLDVGAAETYLRASRPGVRLNRRQVVTAGALLGTREPPSRRAES